MVITRQCFSCCPTKLRTQHLVCMTVSPSLARYISYTYCLKNLFALFAVLSQHTVKFFVSSFRPHVSFFKIKGSPQCCFLRTKVNKWWYHLPNLPMYGFSNIINLSVRLRDPVDQVAGLKPCCYSRCTAK